MSEPHVSHGGRAHWLMGFGAASLVMIITVALTTVDFSNELRQANNRLDLAGQSSVERVHEELREVEALLLRTTPGTSESMSEWSNRLAATTVFPFIDLIGHANDDEGPIEWSTRFPSDYSHPSDRMIKRAEVGPAHQVLYEIVDHHLIMARPFADPNAGRAWDIVVIDMDELTSRGLSSATSAGITWEHRPVPPEAPLVIPDTEKHREYLILGDASRWLFEFEWTDQALKAQGVGFDWEGVVVGGVVALVMGFFASRWMRRRDLEANLALTQELLEQKDLLLLAISHQLRTPLTGVIGFLRLALEDSDDEMSSGQRAELARIALDQAEDAAEIVEDLGVATRLQDGQLVVVARPVAVEPIIRAAFAATRDGQETLELADSDEEILVHADPLRARQVFRNIFGTGAEVGAKYWSVIATRQGGDQVISVMADTRIETDVPVHLERSSVGLPGSLAALRSRLEIARGLCNAMAGDLEVVEIDGSTVIRVLLPAGNSSASVPAADSAGS